jgi:hypothetical protein
MGVYIFKKRKGGVFYILVTIVPEIPGDFVTANSIPVIQQMPDHIAKQLVKA